MALIRYFENIPKSPRPEPSLRDEGVACGELLPSTHTNLEWGVEAPPSACYESLMTNIMTPMMTFQGFDHAADTVYLNNSSQNGQ